MEEMTYKAIRTKGTRHKDAIHTVVCGEGFAMVLCPAGTGLVLFSGLQRFCDFIGRFSPFGRGHAAAIALVVA